MPESRPVGFFKDFTSDWDNKVAMRRAASVAFFSVFSLAPLAALAVRAAELLFGRQQVAGEVVRGAQSLAGPQAAQAVRSVVMNLHQTQGDRLGTVFGVVALAFGASLVFSELKAYLNAFLDVKLPPEHGLTRLVMDRLAGIAMVVIAAALLVSLVTLDVAVRQFGPEPWSVAYQVGYNLLMLGLVFAGSAATYRWLPDAKVPWRAIWPGALTTAVLFEVIRLSFSTYLTASRLGSAYGQAGALALLLVWIYFAILSYFVGAQVVKVYARRHGLPVIPEEPVPGEVSIEHAAEAGQAIAKRKAMGLKDRFTRR